MRIDTAVLGPVLMSLAIIGFVLTVKGYLTPWVETPLTWVGFFTFVAPRRILIIERNNGLFTSSA